MLAVFGSAAIDTVRTPARTFTGLGGAAVFAAMAAGLVTRTGLIAAVGEDFPRRHREALARRADLRGLVTRPGRCFRYDGRYDATLSSRETLRTELNVLEGFEPEVPEEYRRARFVYLANNDPDQNAAVLRQFDRVRFSMCDTIEYWIRTKRDAVRRMIRSADATVINDSEARLLTGEHNLARCARAIMRYGTDCVVIKKGEHGAVAFRGGEVLSYPGFSVGSVADPTGAGDSFAGAMIGRMAERGSAGAAAMREGMAWGNVVGSFAVEGYGTAPLERIGRRDVARRLAEYRRRSRL